MRHGRYGEMKKFWQGKRVLVTGHTGFKGGWLTVWLSSLGAEVVGYALPPETSPCIYDLAKVEDFVDSHIGDVRNFGQLVQLIKASKPEIVFHMAAQPLVRRSYDNPKETFETNVMGTVNLMEAIRTYGASVRVIVNITTDKCYQNNQWAWGYREIDTLGGSDPYSFSKSCAEFVADAYRKSFFELSDIRISSVRAGNVIGGGDWSEDRLIPDLMTSLFSNKSLRLRNPDSIRPWQHVIEPLFGYMTLARRLYGCTSDEVGGLSAFNFGPKLADGMSVESIVRWLIQRDGRDFNFGIDSRQNGHKKEEKLLMLDSAKAKDLLHWESSLSLNEALGWTYDWYKAFYSGESMCDFTLNQIKCYEQLVC